MRGKKEWFKKKGLGDFFFLTVKKIVGMSDLKFKQILSSLWSQKAVIEVFFFSYTSYTHCLRLVHQSPVVGEKCVFPYSLAGWCGS